MGNPPGNLSWFRVTARQVRRPICMGMRKRRLELHVYRMYEVFEGRFAAAMARV
ncbi:hypothetical protein BALAC2494_01687 [Bifidobacterium animalis subsp. lactis CNCM I-2494]|uniref:Uncharacterized protein n=1 Tax=Bifidobacterium animalis subsp. lactis CNCM I-2494 TaxID=1042403 RepID=A0A806FYX0_BIFAN|nr:hypothetical protein BALAC2494_01687 [Bifidobacterium animalis subsp. lactis CNCM I-2494]